MGVLVILLVTLFSGQCIAEWTENLALVGKAVQSSTHGTNGDAQHAVDGDRNSDYYKGSCTHTKFEFNPWWRVDLQNSYYVSKVIITNRGDCCPERIVGTQIRIGDSLENNGNNNELVHVINLIPAEGTQSYEFKPTKGQYVNIVIPGFAKSLTLCEVEVFAEKEKALCSCPSKSLAFGTKAVQSSTYNDLGAAQNAIDGNSETVYELGFCAHTLEENNPWWRVDLNKSYKVSRVVITNRGDCCAERIEGAQIRIGNSLENNGNNNELAATVGPILSGVRKTFKFKPIEGRYVNIFLPGTKKYLALCEVEVFAD
ncbi:hypothetical protein QQF64_013509 [Cirrhinus molitorella]|uniref:Fucolectin tachylectin-4 pentraxin-1 domain-containing protein n=1 Tax=Cirrhinus molitorella TaxID=172907 RepID=A0ABR3LRF6_9TELE